MLLCMQCAVHAVTAGQNKPGGATTSSGKAAHKLDAETEDFHRMYQMP
jgi:hypothetical protein